MNYLLHDFDGNILKIMWCTLKYKKCVKQNTSDDISIFLYDINLPCVVCGKHRQASGNHGGGKTW